MKSRHGRALVIAALVLTFSQAPNALAADVSIKRVPPQVEERSFDPYNPPNPPPPVPPGLRAVTVYNFNCTAFCSADFLDHGTQTPEGVRATIRVTSMNIGLEMPITIWLPTDARNKLKDHENGHAQISLQGYKDSEKLAQEIAGPLIGQTFEATAQSLGEARQAAILLATHEFCQQYHARTRDLVKQADSYYDQVTDHGKNDVDTKDAVQDAMRKFLK